MAAERIEGEARGAVVRAQAQARRLGQRFIGCEHLLYGVAGAEDAAGRVLRARGVTPERVGQQVARLVGNGIGIGIGIGAGAGAGAGAGNGRGTAERPAVLDADALGSIGIDLDAVRERVEAAFGRGALDRSAAGRSGRSGGHLRVTRQARRCLTRSVREAAKDPAGPRGAEHIALTLLAMDASVPREILAALGVSARQLTAEIREAL